MADDLRAFIRKAEAMGQLKIYRGASAELEMGCLTALNWQKGQKALLFDEVPGYPPGFRVMTGSTLTPELAAATLYFPQGKTRQELRELTRRKVAEWNASWQEFPPRYVSNGPILENVLSGEEVDIFKLPIPKWHELDGGPYIGTGSATITGDPDTGVLNMGTYRVQAHENNLTGFYIRSGADGNIHYRKYHERGQACPALISCGHHPLIFRTACTEFPPGSEFGIIGAIQGEPLDVIREEITGLPMPADAEIVLAGFVPPDKARHEGPFGEFTGYYGSGERPAPVFEVERMYFRNSPVLLGSPPGRPPADSTYWGCLVRSALVHNELERCGVPDIRGVDVNEYAQRMVLTVSLKQRYAGHAKQAGLVAGQSRTGASMNKYIIIVDEDIDPSDMSQVIWAMGTRTNPVEDIDFLRRTWNSGLDPALKKPHSGLFTSVAVIDACKPFEWIDDFPKEVTVSPELMEKVRKKFGE